MKIIFYGQTIYSNKLDALEASNQNCRFPQGEPHMLNLTPLSQRGSLKLFDFKKMLALDF